MINFIDVIPLAGALLTILVMVGLAFRAQTVSTADYFLLFFLSICFFSLVHRFLTHSGYIAEYPHLLKVNHLLGILRPPLFFLYVYFAIHPTPRRSIVHGLHFLPFMALLGFLFPYLILRAGAKIDISHGEGADPSRLPPWYFYLGIVYSIVYLFLSIRIFLTASQIPNYLRPATSRWIRFLLAADGAFILGAILILLIPKPGDWELLAYHIMTFTMGIGCVVLVANMNKHITEVVRSKRSAPDIDNERAELYNRARTLVEEEKLYLNERLRLRDVAAKMNVPDYLLSQIINDVAGRSFTELINLYRVDEVKARLASPSFANLTVEAIGSDSGFSSKASFYAAFKRHTGITPKEYRQKLSK